MRTAPYVEARARYQSGTYHLQFDVPLDLGHYKSLPPFLSILIPIPSGHTLKFSDCAALHCPRAKFSEGEHRNFKHPRKTCDAYNLLQVLYIVKELNS